jgi:hypothetical protein
LQRSDLKIGQIDSQKLKVFTRFCGLKGHESNSTDSSPPSKPGGEGGKEVGAFHYFHLVSNAIYPNVELVVISTDAAPTK